MDDDRIDRGPFKGWDEGSVGCFVFVVVLFVIVACIRACGL